MMFPYLKIICQFITLRYQYFKSICIYNTVIGLKFKKYFYNHIPVQLS